MVEGRVCIRKGSTNRNPRLPKELSSMREQSRFFQTSPSTFSLRTFLVFGSSGPQLCPEFTRASCCPTTFRVSCLCGFPIGPHLKFDLLLLICLMSIWSQVQLERPWGRGSSSSLNIPYLLVLRRSDTVGWWHGREG